MPEITPLTLPGARGDDPLAPLVVPPEKGPSAPGLEGPAVTMAAAYGHLPPSLTNGAHPLPDFEEGLRLHRLLDAIAASSRRGGRIALD
jgi:predicted dehydrogenase